VIGSPWTKAAVVAVAAGAALACLPGTASADTGRYIVSSRSASYTFDYQWYRDLPADVHEQGLTQFTNATDVEMCTAEWEHGNLYRIKAYPPGARYQPASSDTDAIVNCAYFLA
jgi:hypothetical protein